LNNPENYLLFSPEKEMGKMNNSRIEFTCLLKAIMKYRMNFKISVKQNPVIRI